MKTVPFYNLKLTDTFWSERQRTVREKTVWAVYNRFYETGRIPTMDCSWKEGDPQKPHKFWGSDVFKWIEGAAYLLEDQKDDRLTQAVNEIIVKVETGIREDGYYNSYYNSVPEPVYTFRDSHELYSLGHMIEAAVAWEHATGDCRLLDLACRGVAHAYKVFVTDGSAGFVTPGHEEIELALMRLYARTKDPIHLKLAQFFVDSRGTNDKDPPLWNSHPYSQSHIPVRQQREAVGHAVRAVYLYCAMADLALETNDQELVTAADSLFADIYEKKMYITGGIGSVYTRESFTVPYHLPNRKAYAETCAAIGLALFCRRMLAIRPDSRYADVAERALYNGMLSGLSLDGEAFFYVNPLELDLSTCSIPYEKQHLARRQEVFNTSCCPPNLVRLIPSIGDFVYTTDGDTLFVHQYFANEAVIDGSTASLKSNYPYDGKVSMSCPGKKLALRRPGWCSHFTTSAPYEEKGGYLYFGYDTVDIDFDMTPIFITAASTVHADQGRVAVMRGPIVYCAEGQDQEVSLFRCRIDPESPLKKTGDTLGGLPILEAQGSFLPHQSELYIPYKKATPTPCRLRLIPYFTFANRGEDDMQVWLLTP